MVQVGDKVRVLAPWQDNDYIGHFQTFGVGTITSIDAHAGKRESRASQWRIEVSWPLAPGRYITEGIFALDELVHA